MNGAQPAAVLILLGSNIEPRENLRRALELLSEALPIEAVSRVYESAPVGAPDTPRFLNAAVRSRTSLSPSALKREVLRPIEARLGRRWSADRNAPRTIDLDLAMVEDRVLEPRQGVELPDPEVLTRAHVALPLADVAADWVHPTAGRTLGEIARELAADADIRPLSGFSLRQPG